METQITAALDEANAALKALCQNQEALRAIAAAGRAFVHSLAQGGCIFSCGNGGSMCDAMHFAEELSGRYRLNRPALPATAISDPGHISCVSNDYGYEYIFSRYLEAHGKAGDVLLAISTSGTSANVLHAVRFARQNGLVVIGLTGKQKSPLEAMADITICTPAGHYADRVQELHIKVIHILIELIERQCFPDNYRQSANLS